MFIALAAHRDKKKKKKNNSTNSVSTNHNKIPKTRTKTTEERSFVLYARRKLQFLLALKRNRIAIKVFVFFLFYLLVLFVEKMLNIRSRHVRVSYTRFEKKKTNASNAVDSKQLNEIASLQHVFIITELYVLNITTQKKNIYTYIKNYYVRSALNVCHCQWAMKKVAVEQNKKIKWANAIFSMMFRFDLSRKAIKNTHTKL